jgi:hypothetical protein
MMPFRLQILPTLAAFGPLFVVIGMIVPIFKTPGWPSLLAFVFAIGGALMTSIALSIMFREIIRLRQLLEAKTQ